MHGCLSGCLHRIAPLNSNDSGNFVHSLPSIWSLGLHVCRRTSDDFQDFAKNLEDLVKNEIPFDTDCISENLLPKDLTDLPSLMDKLNQNGEHN